MSHRYVSCAYRYRWLFLMAALLLYVAGAAALPLLTSWCVPAGPDFSADQTAPLPDIFGANQVTQTFYSSNAGLASVSLGLTAQSPGDQAIVLLEPIDGGTAYSITLAVAQTPAVYWVGWEPLADSRGRDYALRLLAPANAPSHRISVDVLPSDAFPQSELSLNNAPLEADLAFRLCYRPLSLPHAWKIASAQWWAPYNQLLNRMSQYKPIWLKKPTQLVLIAACGLGLLLLFLTELPSAHRRSCSTILQQAVALFLTLTMFIVTANMLCQWEAYPTPITAHRAAGPLPSPAAAGEQIVEDLLLALASGQATVDAPESEYVDIRRFGLNGEARPVLWMHPPAAVSYPLTIPHRAFLEFSPALHPQVWLPEYGDGVEFIVYADDGEIEQVIFYQVVDAKNVPEDRRWHDTRVDLSLYAGQQITITFRTYPLERNEWDWAGWGNPAVIVAGDNSP